ncbi:hypothetical protein QN277_018575 [Acacia crassicarpa]|uniref:Uncharacterized protein n=1 Tax=Acacia crassicarpa TaxID=499986 RepID=A0AAE1JWT8_9FABA|nr:hypothetical protein QN277_018575 [Acacia crassicarpa]
MDGDQETSVAPSSLVTAKKKKKGSIRSIFMHVDTVDLFLMVLGVFASLGHSFTTPLVLLISSRLMNSIGSSSTVGPTSFTHSINKNAVNMLYLAAGSFFACFLRERQAARMRARYLKALLKQVLLTLIFTSQARRRSSPASTTTPL